MADTRAGKLLEFISNLGRRDSSPQALGQQQLQELRSVPATPTEVVDRGQSTVEGTPTPSQRAAEFESLRNQILQGNKVQEEIKRANEQAQIDSALARQDLFAKQDDAEEKLAAAQRFQDEKGSFFKAPIAQTQPQPAQEDFFTGLLQALSQTGENIGGQLAGTTSEGEPTAFANILRGVARAESPRVSDILESNVARERALADAEKKAEASIVSQQAKADEATLKFGRQITLEEIKANIKNDVAVGKLNDKQGKLLMDRSDKLEKKPQFRDSTDALKEVNDTLVLIGSGSSFSFPSLINKLIKLSGDNRISEPDRKAFNDALGIVEGMKQNVKKRIIGGQLTGKTNDEIMKIVNSKLESVTKGLSSQIQGELDLMRASGIIAEEKINEFEALFNKKYNLSELTKQFSTEEFTDAEKVFIRKAREKKASDDEIFALIKKRRG